MRAFYTYLSLSYNSVLILKYLDFWWCLVSHKIDLRNFRPYVELVTKSTERVGRDMLFNLASFIYWRVVNSENPWNFLIDNDWKKSRWVGHEYTVDDIVYVEKMASTANYITNMRTVHDNWGIHKRYSSSPVGRY